MTQSEKDAIVKKCVELGFESDGILDILEYKMPFGNKTELWFDFSEDNCDLLIWSDDVKDHIPIRKIDSPEDLETLFNAICPEKYRLPFS